ncbi:CotG/ExsB N-terminal domain-containing protein [Bacillus siamensis]|uniref:CotG/ExsB N-terminal domain-containing protein n=1 Tax=Bacillus siamensis TaxID=659243 RepID=UPI000695DAB7|nr:hypothetical protein [Bacillus siamensis]
MNAISVKEIEHGVAVAHREGLGEYLHQEPVSRKSKRRSRSQKRTHRTHRSRSQKRTHRTHRSRSKKRTHRTRRSHQKRRSSRKRCFKC